MALFSAATEEMLRGRVVHIAPLAELRFASATMRLWTGFGPLDAGGYTWEGIGDLGAVEGLSLGPGVPTDPLVLTLTGLAEFTEEKGIGQGAALDAMLADQRAEVYGREAHLWVQCFNADWSLLDGPVHVRTAIMDRLQRDTDPGRAATHLIRLYCEPITVDKHRAVGSMLTHKDQQRRYPGDLGLERKASISVGNKEW